MNTGIYNTVLRAIPPGSSARVEDIARLADLSPSTVRKYATFGIDRGEVFSTHFGRRTYYGRYTVEHLADRRSMERAAAALQARLDRVGLDAKLDAARRREGFPHRIDVTLTPEQANRLADLLDAAMGEGSVR